MLVLAGVMSSGCDSEKAERKDLEAAAAAALGEGLDAKAKEAEAKAAAERKRMYEEQKAKEAAQNARLDELADSLVKAPDKPSKNLVDACEKYMTSYPEWVRAVWFDDDAYQLNFFDSKAKNLGTIKGNCAKLANIAATDCMSEVIKAVSAEDFPEADRKLLQQRPDDLFSKCVEKFAAEKQP